MSEAECGLDDLETEWVRKNPPGGREALAAAREELRLLDQKRRELLEERFREASEAARRHAVYERQP